MLLLSAMVDKNYDVALKFYDPKTGTIMIRKDSTYKEYCYADPTYNKLAGINMERQAFATKTDPVTDKEIALTQAFTHGWSFARHDAATGELDVAGNPITQSEKSDQVWESDIKAYESYLHDKDLAVGMYYDVTGRARQVEMPVPENVSARLQQILESKESGQFKEHLSEWARTLSQPIPHLCRTAVDIETDAEHGRSIADIIDKGDKTITAISFRGDKIARVLALGSSGEPIPVEEFDLVLYDDESSMLCDAFKTMEEYPVILTYNGTSFDLPYMESRAKCLGIVSETEKDIPFYTRKTDGRGQSTHTVTFRKSIHVDLYSVMSNKAFQIYVFGGKYTKVGLDDVSKAILGRGKLKHDVFEKEQDVVKLANYCYHDSLLTYDLTAHENDMLMNMLVTISRIARMPLDDVARYRVSQWIRSRFYYHHRKNNFLIPNRSDLNERDLDTKNDAVTKGKKYQGGAVTQPDSGIYFGVAVVDFASLYPSIVKSYNISYETVRCPHEECRTANPLQGTNHWCCTKKYGMTSLIIGSLRDLRVQYYKRLSKDPSISEEMRGQYDVIAQALKVILNAAYGVLGADAFPLYFPPAAEAVTAIGRSIINGCIKICKDNNAKVLYSDTDSVFLHSPTKQQIGNIMKQAQDRYRVDLEVDKTYKFCVFSERKKNYYGMLKDGKMDVKGLAGKKSNTPQFVKDLFSSAMGSLETIRSEGDIEPVLEKIVGMTRTCTGSVRSGDIPLESMAFTNLLGENLGSYSITLKKGDIDHGSLKEYDPRTKSMEPLKPGKYPLKKTFNPDKIECPTDMGIYRGLPLHVKSALWLCTDDAEEENTKNSNPEQKAVRLISSTDLKRGDDVSYIKMTKPIIALPLNMFGETDNAAMKWHVPEKFGSVLKQCSNIELGKATCCVDVEKYISLVTATLNPILEPLGVELWAKKSAPAKKAPASDTNLDVFLQ